VSKVSTETAQPAGKTEDVKGIVFNIQRYSIHDGPGIRSIVFLKGCPLRCAWCSNPESQNPWIEVAHGDTLCSKCGKCIKVCPNKAISVDEKGVKIDRALCKNCGKCVEACLPEALKIYGKEMTAGEVLREVEKDSEFYRESGGGVTASGGEPLYQPTFLAAIFKLCQESGIRTAVETTGCASEEALKEVLPYTNLFLFDMKHFNTEEHQKWTKQPTDRILNNLRLVVKSGTPLIVRVPLIPKINDTPEVLKGIAAIVKRELKEPKVHLLPYHRFGMGKYAMVDRQYSLADLTRQSNEELERDKQIFLAAGIDCEVIG
jgi:pyruvate formate lyase activating enzyme